MAVEIKNLKKAAERIKKAVQNKEKIIIYGDADLDGVASVIISKEAVGNLSGAKAIIYFPDREKEGHGLTKTGLDCLEKYAPALLVVFDCGIGNFKEVKTAKKMGFKVIIIDHHEVLDRLPEALIVVDPKQKEEKYPFKDFSSAGLAFKLSEVLLKEKLSDNLRKSFLELAALATIADMSPQIGENKEIIAEGLSSLESTWRPGLQALLGLKELESFGFLERIYKINSLLNIRNLKNRLPASFRLLTAASKSEAEKFARFLLEKGFEKKQRIKEITEEVEERAALKPSEPIIFEGSADWELVLLGNVASILSKKYKKPVFLYKKQKDKSQAGARAPSGFNLVEAMKACPKIFITYGGHPQAAGFCLKNKDLEKLKKSLTDYFKSGG